MAPDMMLRLHIFSFKNQSCILNCCGNIISFLINGAFLPLQKSQHRKKPPSQQTLCLLQNTVLGLGNLLLHPGRGAGSPVWCQLRLLTQLFFSEHCSPFASYSQPKLQHNKIIFSCWLQRKKAMERVSYLCWNTCEGLMCYGIGGSLECIDLRR